MLFSGECGGESNQGWFGFVSINNENPINKVKNEKWVTKRLQETSMLSTLVGYKYQQSRYYLSLMNLWGGDDLDGGAKASLSELLF